MILQVLQEPSPILRQKASPVSDPQDPKIKALIRNMIDTMHAEKGIGLAANQVGSPLAIAVVETDEEPIVLFNPKIIRKSWRTVLFEEGCLSLKGVILMIRRARSILVEAMDNEGKTIRFKAKELFAIVIQHEVDHLNGILIIDKGVKRNN
jgi:peptide deformylase